MISCINLVELNISTRMSIYSCYRHKDTKFFNKIGEINTLTVSTIFLGKKLRKEKKERKKERKTDFMIFACLIDEEVQEETVEVLICLF